MRIKNKEIRQRRHRKEQTIKAAIREAKANAGKKDGAAKPKATKKTTKKAE